MCGARLEWHPGEAAVVCPHCGTVNERSAAPSGPWGIGKAEIAELDLRGALEAGAPPAEMEETATVACPGCGAEVELDPGTLAENCPFCGTPLARAEAHAHRHPMPQAVLPFALDEAAARARIGDWLGALWFAPSDLARFARRDRPLGGVYLPHYTYDARGTARYQGWRGTAHYVTVGAGKNRSRQRRVRWSPRSGEVTRHFDDVLVAATVTLEEEGASGDALAAWDLQALEPYHERFLAGFRARLPDLGLLEGWQRAKGKMEEVLRTDAKRDIGGDEQRIDTLHARFSDAAFKHVLLPVWLGTYRYRGRLYRLTVNGRTGKIAGARPYSPWKIALAAAAALIVAVALGLLFGRG